MQNVHLLVLIHGMWGNPEHLAEMARIIRETKGPSSDSDEAQDTKLRVLVAQTNDGQSTYDGIDWGAERVAAEIGETIKEVEDSGGKVTKFSIAGYSLGGLVARYVLGILYQRGFFANVKPVNFATVATPHIGLLRSSTTWSAIKAALGPKLLSRTGEQFYAVDNYAASGKSLLEVMVDRKGVFYQALSLFPHIHIYGNIVNDMTVEYLTALIDTTDPFINHQQKGLTVEFDPKYDPIITSYAIPDVPPPPAPSPKPLSPAWFRTVNPKRYLPPPLQAVKFPFNVLATVFMPVLLPTFITLVIIRLTMHSRSSRARIRLLEKDEVTNESRLVNIFMNLERDIEGAVRDMAEEAPDGNTEPSSLISTSSEKLLSSPNGVTHTAGQDADSKDAISSKGAHAQTAPGSSRDGKDNTPVAAGQPVLTPAQHEMVKALNALPLSKHLVFIDPIRNAHATIVARDVKGFEFHKRGWGVLQHWADGFVL